MDENRFDSQETVVETVNNGGNGEQPGKGAAIASLVLGIISLATCWLSLGAIIGLITGVVGLICASSSKKAGYVGGLRTAGFVCSLIGTIAGGLVFVACLACVGCAGCSAAMDSLNY